MKLVENYNNETAAAFGREFLERLAPYPFGGMPKRDLDCLVFSLLKNHALIPGKMNRDKAYSLGISESKYKSLLVDSDAKFSGEHDIEESVRKVFEKLKDKKGVHLEGDTIVFLEENPVVRAELAQAMKEKGLYTDTSFNSEIVKIKAADFLDFALAKEFLDENEILRIFNNDKAGNEKLKRLEDANKPMKEIMQDVLNMLKRQENFGLHTIVELFVYARDVASAKRHG